ncbi:hypothetical protein K488DRAFT_83284 [Vararia minispora EC-137]|uniref:Uncharacterized protein n=1 Tax=Vararia minispora EC-137 TaxID=1314806 RepID=A0ACB8QTM9_9AGAM|nr:hypothetical protein K488DRAFT_83284 [Vararia minispora EC-137]
MGRTAKVCKRTKKTASSAQKNLAGDAPSARPEQTVVAIAAKKIGLKSKAAVHKRRPGTEGRVLGGADYVDIMMGGRKKAREEATKLPPSDE